VSKFWKVIKTVTLVVPAIEGIVKAVKDIFSSEDEGEDRT